MRRSSRSLSGTEEPVRIFAARVSPSFFFFPLLGVQASLGRTFLAEESQTGRSSVVLLSSAFWRSRMGADPGIVGRILRLDGQSARVWACFPQLSIPTIRRSTFRSRWTSTCRVRSSSPLLFNRAEAGPIVYWPVGTERSLLWLLLGGGGVLLLIACANTAQLLLARSLRRGREVAIRKALGASRTERDLVVPALAGALKDENAFVRRDAAEALGKIGREAREATPALAAALKDRNHAVKKAATEALKKVDPQAAMKAGTP